MSDDGVIRGRGAIAEALGRTEKTITRWHACGILPATKTGPFQNSELVARTADIARLRRRFGGGDSDG